MTVKDRSGFQAQPHATLAAHSATGDGITVACQGETLVIQHSGGVLGFPAAEIARVRFGFGDTKSSRYHVARVFPAGDGEPLVIQTKQSRDPAYAATMRRYAEAVAAAHGIGAVERGLTDKAARNTVIFGASFALLFIGVTWCLWVKEAGSTGAIVFTLALVGIAIVFAWHAHVFERPRPLSSLAELEKHIT